jgi:hypothetical protein
MKALSSLSRRLGGCCLKSLAPQHGFGTRFIAAPFRHPVTAWERFHGDGTGSDRRINWLSGDPDIISIRASNFSWVGYEPYSASHPGPRPVSE